MHAQNGAGQEFDKNRKHKAHHKRNVKQLNQTLHVTAKLRPTGNQRKQRNGGEHKKLHGLAYFLYRHKIPAFPQF